MSGQALAGKADGVSAIKVTTGLSEN